jgi:hypothetical protein
MGDPYPRGYDCMSMGVNSYPPVYMGDSIELFFCRGYGYGVVITGGYLPIVISNPGFLFPVPPSRPSVREASSMASALLSGPPLHPRLGVYACDRIYGAPQPATQSQSVYVRLRLPAVTDFTGHSIRLQSTMECVISCSGQRFHLR